MASICLLFVFLGIQGSQWKELLAHVCQPVCIVSCVIICASEANPAEDLLGSSHSLFFSLLLLLLNRFSRVRLCATPWTAAYQASPSMGFSRQEHWSGLPFPSPVLFSRIGFTLCKV